MTSTKIGTKDEDTSLKEVYDKAETLVMDIESGKFATKDLQKRIEEGITELEGLTVNLSSLDLFSTNEQVDELPTSSLPFMLVPCYLGVLHHNYIVDRELRTIELKIAKVYYRDYLKRIRNYGIIDTLLPFENDENCEESSSSSNAPKLVGEDLRKVKIERFKQQKDLKDAMERIKKELKELKDDDSLLRELYISQLKYWGSKLIEELGSIDEEIPILEFMAQRGQQSQPEPPKKSVPLKPFILARSEQQKKVLGLGYPSIPTMTVDEWYQERFGDKKISAPSQPNQHGHAAGDECSSDEDEKDSELERIRKMAYDEYKDGHRRGWGNTHNKG